MSATTSNRQRVMSAALIVGVLYAVTKLLGLLREVVFTYYFGTQTAAAEALALVIPIPDLIFILISGGALGSAFIPIFAGFFADPERPDDAGAWQLFSAIVTLVIVAATVVAGVTALFAPQLLAAYYAEILAERPEIFPLAVPLLRIMLLAQIVFGASGVIMVTLNARQHFTMPAVATLVYNIGIIVGTIAFQPGVQGVAWGMVLGSLGHLLIQLPALRGVGGRYRPRLTLRLPAVRRVLWLMAPRVLGLSFSYLNLVVTPYIAQTLSVGSVAALRFAYRIMLVPQGVIGQSLGVASFPTFAELAARGDIDGMRRILADTVRLILFLSLPIAVLLWLLAQPLTALAFQRASFDAEDTRLVATGLAFYAPAVIAISLIEIVSRAFYALEDTLTPVLVGLVQLVLMVALGLWLGRSVMPAAGLLGLAGVALGFVLANYAEVALLFWLLRGKLGRLDGRYLLAGGWRMGLAATGMAAVIALMQWAVGPQPTMWRTLLLVAGATLGGMTVYVALCAALRVEELAQVVRAVQRVGGRVVRR